MLNKLHTKLAQKSNAYESWHNITHISFLHLFILLVALGIMGAGLHFTVTKTLTETNDSNIARAGGAKTDTGTSPRSGGKKNQTATTTTSISGTSTTTTTIATTTTDTNIIVTTTSTTTSATSTTTTTTTTTLPLSEYNSTLVNGYTPRDNFVWSGSPWRVNAGSTYIANMDHSVRVSPSGQKIRFEIHDTENDKAANDDIGKRRSEISGSKTTVLQNDKELWGAYSFIHTSWPDPVGMATKTGGVYGQIHMGSTYGGSPAVAFRRDKNGNFWITTRGENDSAGTTRYRAPLSFDQTHDLVYKLILSPTNGSLVVWLDGKEIVNVTNVSIGSQYNESYWNFGLYFSGGITSPIIAEFANSTYPSATSLLGRTGNPPAWPTN